MTDTNTLINYGQWVFIIVLTLIFYNILSKRSYKYVKLMLLTLFPVWIMTAILNGVIDISINNTNAFTSSTKIIGLLAFTLPMVLMIGGITFLIKYFNSKKRKKAIIIDKKPLSDNLPHYCRECGSQHANNDKFCSKCGASINQNKEI